jgi:signal-transduction protein with cAMP-binding, CBS, and nucleotidyltransferase domain
MDERSSAVPTSTSSEPGAELRGLLSKRRPFDLLEPPHLDWLLARLQPARYPAGSKVLNAGSTPDRLHIVSSGIVSVEVPGAPAGRGLAELAAGDCFPLEELHEGRSAFFSYRASSETVAQELPSEHFRALQVKSSPFRESCERRARRMMEKLQRIQRAQLAQMDTVMSQAGALQSGTHDLAATIRLARDAQGLAAAARAVRDLARRMMAQGVTAAQITRMFSALNDHIAERAIHLEVERSGVSPVDFCWIALGSEGRMEQTLCTDQDNGLVFAPPPGTPAGAVRDLLLPVAKRINAALAECGFPLCKGDVMAGNPAWCLSVDEWHDRFRLWIEKPDPQALLHASIFFDLRGVYGNRELVRSLQAWLAKRAPGDRRFLALMTENALENRPPLGMISRFSVEKGGSHPGTIDLKRDAIAIFVDAARVLGLASGSVGPSTEQRLREAGERKGISKGEVESWIEAFQYVQVLRFRHHDDLARAGTDLHNRVDPYALNALEQRFLLEALRQARQLQDRIARAHRLDASA